jgi:hypothetical protein
VGGAPQPTVLIVLHHRVLIGYLHKIGVPAGYSFHDVPALEDWVADMVPQPVLAVLLLFPVVAATEAKRKEEEAAIAAGQQPALPGAQAGELPLLHIRQLVGNACGTIGLLHAAANLSRSGELPDVRVCSCPWWSWAGRRARLLQRRKSCTTAVRVVWHLRGCDEWAARGCGCGCVCVWVWVWVCACVCVSWMVATTHTGGLLQVAPGSWLGKFLQRCDGMGASPADSAAAGKVLEDDIEIEETHAEAEAASVDRAARHQDCHNHFTSFVQRGGAIWELDGRKRAPVHRGESSTSTFLVDTLKVIKERFVALAPGGNFVRDRGLLMCTWLTSSHSSQIVVVLDPRFAGGVRICQGGWRRPRIWR